MRSVPNVFGTSLIDLLVGALCMVALLWVLQARNSGLTGEGEVERISAFALVEQYGVTHILKVTFGQEGNWTCTFNLKAAGDALACTTRPGTILSVNPAHPWSATDGGTLTFDSIDGHKLDPPMEIRIRVNDPKGGFLGGVNLNVDRLNDLPLQATLDIAPCCSLNEPHYLHLLALAPSGKIEKYMFWHEAVRLLRLLECTGADTLPGCGSIRRSNTNWVRTMQDGLKIGTLAISPGSFVFLAKPEDCQKKQNANPGHLEIAFDPDGDVTFSTPDTAEAYEAAGKPQGPEHARLIASFGFLMHSYGGTP